MIPARMPPSSFSSAMLVALVALATSAHGEAPFGGVLWQPLPPTVQRVCVGPDGRVWQVSPPADPLAQAAALQQAVEREFRQPTPHVRGAAPILFEPGGRVWFAGWGLGVGVISGYDGTTWIHRPLQDRHVLFGRQAVGDHLFFVDSRGIDHFDGRTWAYKKLADAGPGGFAGSDPPIVRLQPDGKGLVALVRSGTTSALWRWRGEWTELPSPGNLGGPPLRLAAAADGIWLFNPMLGLFFQSFDREATVPALLERATAADAEAADRAAAVLSTRWPTILPAVQAALATATDRAVIERLQRVAAELPKAGGRAVQVGGFMVRSCTNLLSLPDGTVVVAAQAVTAGDGREARPGVVLARPGGRFDALFDADVVASLHGVTDETVPLTQADGKVWLPGTARRPACLVDLGVGRVVATMPERSYGRLQAVTPEGTVFAAADAAHGVVAFTPGRPDPRPMLRAEETRVLRGRMAIDGAVVASDGSIFGVQRGRGLCGLAGGDWRPVAAGAAHVDGVVWSAVGTDGAVLVKLDRGFGLRIDGGWDFAADLRPLVEKHRDAVARCFRRFAGPAGIVADTAGNVWALDDGRLSVLVADRWEDAALALQAAGRASNGGLQFLSGVGDGSKVYVSDLSAQGFVGEVAAGTPRLAAGPVTNERRLMWLGVREPGGGLWVPATQSDPGLSRQFRRGQFPQRLTEAGVTHEVTGNGWPLLADADGHVWFASGTSGHGLIDELIVWRDGTTKARLPFPSRAEPLRLLAAGPGRVLAWDDLGLRVITARAPAAGATYEVGPVTTVRSPGPPPRTVEPLRSWPIAVIGNRLVLAAAPDLGDDDCRLFIADLPAR